MRVAGGQSGRTPDVMFIASEHSERIKPTHLDGPADLAIEAISPDSRARDRGEKYYEYEQAGGRECWILYPDCKRAEFCVLSAEGFYEPAPIGDDGIYRSAALDGLWLEAAWLWTRPSVVDVLKAWGVA